MDNLTIFDFQTNNYKELRSRIGNFCYNLLKISSRFLANHLWLYYILNYT